MKAYAVLPLVLFIGLMVFLAIGLSRDPGQVPSPLIGKPVPEFNLPALRDPGQSFSQHKLKGKISLLNVWASWCASCRVEHPLLLELAANEAIPIYGLNYKDDRNNAIAWLDRLGDPYIRSAFDEKGSVAIDLGVYGAPETYLIDSEGTIAYKHIGPLTARDWQETLLPLILTLREQTR